MDVLARLDPYSTAVLAMVTVQRLAELVHARGNEARLLARGGVEFGAEHYPLIVALHAAWLAGLWLLASGMPPHPLWLMGYLILQGLRLWVQVTLGKRWTTRIIVLNGASPVRGGPYRFLAHPNYAVVAAEILVLPMAYGLVVFALVFSVLNGAVLAVRIRVEEQALRQAANIPTRAP